MIALSRYAYDSLHRARHSETSDALALAKIEASSFIEYRAA